MKWNPKALLRTFLIFLVVGGLSILIFFGSIWWFFGGRLFVFKESCPKGHLSAVDSCDGWSEPGFQNSGRYYLIAKGPVAQPFRDHYIQSALNSAMGRHCRDWKEEICSFKGTVSWRCFTCDRPASNGNTHYYLWGALSPDGSRGIYFSGSGYKPEDKEALITP